MSTNNKQHTRTVMFSSGEMASDLSPAYSFKKNEGGAEIMTVDNVAVFRSGVFRDSTGYQKAFSEFDIHAMVSNYNLLKDTGIFADVPVRDGHPGFFYSGGSMSEGKVVGWHTGLRAEVRTSPVDGQEYTYLIAAYDILDEDARKNILSGLWRNRSAEIRPYLTNDEVEHYPVYAGVAFVDIPAVEGLNTFSASQPAGSMVILEKENSVSASTQPPAAPALPVPPVPAADPVDPPVAEPVAPVASEFAAPKHMFTMNGAATSDFAAVQAHIVALEAFRSESIEAGRANFVKGLADSNKIAATQIDSMTAFVKGLAPEAYEQYKAMMEETPEIPIFGSFAAPAPTAGGAAGAEAAERDKLVATVQYHKQAGLTTEEVMATSSYKSLVALDPTFKL